MGTTEAKANLNEARGKLKQKFARLMHDDQLFEEGRKEEMFGKHQTRLHQTEEELDKIMSSTEELDKLWLLYYNPDRNEPGSAL
jgi:uncharacterized protein YjbJ (UPF0337 family)